MLAAALLGLGRRATRAPAPAPERRALSASSLLAELWGGGLASAAGVNVTTRKALESTPVLTSALVISESLAMLPLILYRRVTRPEGEGKERARSHPLYRLFNVGPDEDMDAFFWKQAMALHALLGGNAYSLIERGGDGRVRALRFLEPDKVRPYKRDGRLLFGIREEGGARERVAYPDEVFRIRDFSLDGVLGESRVKFSKDAIGLALAAQDFGSRYFSNGAKPSGYIELDGPLDDPERQKELSEEFTAALSGERANRTAVFAQGTKYHPISVEPNKAQFLETRVLQGVDAPRPLRVTPHLYGDLTHGTFSNVENLGLQFVVFTMTAHFRRWEHAIAHQLLTEAEQRDYFAEFLVDALLRGDHAARGSFYRTLWQVGAISPNEIRAKENMDPIPDGDRFFVQTSYTTLDRVGEEPAPAPAPPPPAAPPGDPPAEPPDPEAGAARALRAFAERETAAALERVRNIVAPRAAKLAKGGEAAKAASDAVGEGFARVESGLRDAYEALAVGVSEASGRSLPPGRASGAAEACARAFLRGVRADLAQALADGDEDPAARAAAPERAAFYAARLADLLLKGDDDADRRA